MKLTNQDIIEYNKKVLPLVENVEPTYSVICRARNNRIQHGENIDIDMFFTGSGIPSISKLHVEWFSPSVIDASVQGTFTYCVKSGSISLNGIDMIVPLSGEKYVEHNSVGQYGVTTGLNQGFFFPSPDISLQNIGEPFMPQVMGERSHSGYHPCSISLKTMKKAKAGDYKIDITLTYQHQNIVKQASDKVEIHITSWWDRNQWWVLTLGTGIVLASLVLQTVSVFVPLG